MLVIDGLGGLQHPQKGGRSELEIASIPNLDQLCQESACGVTTPVLTGVTPGSGPGHLSLFGYDPFKHLIGRGVLEALGLDTDMREGDVAARGNFCTIDEHGMLIDRRAGRISSEESTPLCTLLNEIDIPGITIQVHPVKEYRFVLILRGMDLSERITESDPQRTGMPPLEIQPEGLEAAQTAEAANEFVRQASELLKEEQANMVLLRGFSKLPHLTSMSEIYGLNPAGIAAYPMYRGIAKVAGMTVLSSGTTFDQEITSLREHFDEHDFFYLHYKPADAAGEDGDFESKVKALENLDDHIPSILDLNPDVLIIAGDHSTPSLIGAHSWHPVPFLLHSKWTLGEGINSFNEHTCASGSLGRFPATDVMLLGLAHANKLAKFGP